ncbi:phage tail tape measure protein [Flavobacterium enshiense]|uniref:phage tail tape measure protein n=1 Tax=Flavobacterium enshiense TaxID=1341165 RepID=UPI00345CF3BB
MANKNGVITRKEVIEDDALHWGTEYVKNLEKAISKNNEFKSNILELAKAAKTMKNAGNNSELLKAQQKEVEIISKTKDVWKEQIQLENQLISIKRKQQLASESTNQAVIKERVELEVMNKAMKQAALEKLGLVGAYQKLNNARTEAKNKLRDLIVAEGENSKAVKAAQKEFDQLDDKVRKADKAVGDFTKNVGNYPQIGKMTGMLKNLVGAFGLVVGVDAAARALGAAFEKIKEFDQSVADLRAITGATGKDLDYLKKKAIEVGKETKGGAVKVVEAYKLIASAQPELLNNVQNLNKVTEATLLLSKAAGMELPEAATALTDAMNQFGADASRAAEFVDALANGAKYGSAEIPEVTDALLKFGAVAKSSNVNIQESTALIELLAEKGLKGAEAGTALRNVLLKISAPDALPKDAQKVFDGLGISMEKLKDNSIPVQEKMEMLKPLLNDNAYLVKVFGVENAVAARNILANTKRLEELTKYMYEYGTATEQAGIRTDTLQGETERLSAEYDSFIISLNEGKGAVSGFFSLFIYLAREALKDLGRLNKDWDELFEEARMKGAEAGIKNVDKAFRSYTQNGIKDQEALNLIMNQASMQLGEFEKALNKKNQELADFNPYAINFGKSGKTLKEEKERLEAAVAQQKSIIEEAKKRILEITTKAAEEETKKDEDVTKLTEEELKKRLEALKKARAEYLKNLQKQLDDEYALMKFRLERGAELNQEIVDDETKSAEERLNAYMEVEQLKRSEAELTLQYELTKNALSKIDAENTSTEKMNAIKKDAEQKAKDLIAGVKLSENATNEEKLIYEKFQKDKEDIERKGAKNKQAILDSEVAKVQKKIDAELLKQDTELQNALTAENERFRILTEGQDNIEAEVEAHERRVFAIRQEYAKKGLQSQIDALQELVKDETISEDERKKIENRIANYKRELSELTNEKFAKDNESRLLSEEEFADRVKELSMELKDELVNLSNSIFDARISNIDNEIQKNEAYYNRQLELAGNDQAQKDLITKEAEKKREELEKKKRKEQHKQAVFNKVMAGVDIGIKTAQAIVAALAIGPPQGVVMAALAGAIGAVQLAAVLAAPIPKYKKGRKDGPKEVAFVGDGGVHEVIERKTGEIELTPNTDTLVQLYAGDKVHSSVEEYQRAMRAANMASLASEKNQLNAFMNQNNDFDRLEKKIEEGIQKGFKRAKININNNGDKIDIPHAIWKAKNTSWD